MVAVKFAAQHIPRAACGTRFFFKQRTLLGNGCFAVSADDIQVARGILWLTTDKARLNHFADASGRTSNFSRKLYRNLVELIDIFVGFSNSD
jgi:hypothetical protein